MANFNKTTLIGQLAEDPRLAPENFGRSAATITVVVFDHYRDKERNLIETKDYFKVRLYGAAAGYAAMNLARGSRVFVVGRLKNERWEDRETKERRYSTVIVVDREEGLQSLDIHGDGESLGVGAGDSPETSTASHSASHRSTVDASSPEFEQQAGIQPIPF